MSRPQDRAESQERGVPRKTAILSKSALRCPPASPCVATFVSRYRRIDQLRVGHGSNWTRETTATCQRCQVS